MVWCFNVNEKKRDITFITDENDDDDNDDDVDVYVLVCVCVNVHLSTSVPTLLCSLGA